MTEPDQEWTPTPITKSQAQELRKPFPKSSVGVLPKPYKKESPKGNCAECGGYHGLPAVHLDYVGHAAVTDRLLSVDPHWTWEPFSYDERGLPALDSKGNLWIRLTVCGVTRIGVGDGPNAKVIVGDALRNAAMRFGVALDLWSKEELEGHGVVSEVTPPTGVDTTTGEVLPVEDPPEDTPPPKTAKGGITDNQRKALHKLVNDLKLTRGQKLAGISALIGRTVDTSNDLTSAEAKTVITSLQERLDQLKAPQGQEELGV